MAFTTTLIHCRDAVTARSGAQPPTICSRTGASRYPALFACSISLSVRTLSACSAVSGRYVCSPFCSCRREATRVQFFQSLQEL